MSQVSCCNISGRYIKENGEIDMQLYYDCVLESVTRVINMAKNEKPNGTKKWGISEIRFDKDKICKCEEHYIIR